MNYMYSYSRILDFIKTSGNARPVDIRRELGISNVMVHKYLRTMVASGRIVKSGRSPLVFYTVAGKLKIGTQLNKVGQEIKRVIEENYLYLSPVGEIVSGLAGFEAWIKQTKQEKYFLKLAKEYVSARLSANKQIKNSLIDATHKLESTFEKIYIEKLYYADFYSLPKFGKTYLGQLVLHAKQAQSEKLIKQISYKMAPIIKNIIKVHKINAVGLIPHSIPRSVQFLRELERNLELNLPKINLVKAYRGEIPVAQKTLGKLDERIKNAAETIFVKESGFDHKSVLLIDDAVGSGATLNETAKKVKKMGVSHVFGFAIVGSIKGFEVITEV